MSQLVDITDHQHIRIIRFNRAEKKNAITQEMYQMMATALETAAQDAIRVLVFTGQPGIFSAGNDIADFIAQALSPDASAPATVRFLKALALNETAMLAEVDGLAIGIGTTLLFHCDLVFSSDRSVFKTPFLDLGLVPEAGSSLLAPRLMGPQNAFELLVMGEELDAKKAHELGLVNRITSADKVHDQTMKAAEKIRNLPPEALAISRRLLRGSQSDLVARIDEECRLFANRLKSDETREALTAFMEKRPPRFTFA